MPRRSFREILRKGRVDLHEIMQVPALYIPFDGATPIPVPIRDHSRVVQTGDMGSGIKGYATMAEITPKLLWMVEHLSNARNGAIFSVAPGEAYRVENTDPRNDITRTAHVSQLTEDEASGLPVPDDANVFSIYPVGYGYVVPDSTGHGLYSHGGGTQYLLADMPVLLENDRAGFVDETQLPRDIDTYYDGTHIKGFAGDGMDVVVRLTFTPDDEEATDLTMWLDIGGAQTRIFESNNALEFGAGEPHRIIENMIAFNRATWDANGARVWVECDGPGVISNVSYQIHRKHKARTN